MTAHERVIKRLEVAGCRPRAYGSGKVTAHCPGPGHWRGDQIPSLVITPGDGCVLVYCHAGCGTDDVLAAIGLDLRDLYDEPREHAPKAPSTRRLKAAIGLAGGFPVTDRYVYTRLLDLADYGAAVIPAMFQPKSQRAFAGANGISLVNLQHAVAHLACHGWLAVACTRKDCAKPWPHRGQGHRAGYAFPGVGTDCTDEACRQGCRPGKTAPRSLLRLVTSTTLVAAVTLLSACGGPAHPPTTYPQPKAAADLRLCAPHAVFYRLRGAVFYWPPDPHISCPRRPVGS